MTGVQLRDVTDGDFAIFFLQQQDDESAHMAAFGTRDLDAKAYATRWKNGLADGTTVAKTIVVNDEVCGFVATFLRDAKPQVTYWIARSCWGRGIATAALTRLLTIVATRPIYASAARDNAASLRVLEKCGFRIYRAEMALAAARGVEVEEVFLELAE